MLAEDQELVQLEPASVVLSALKPAEDGEGMILRLLNPSDAEVDVTVHLGLPYEAVSVRLDETPDGRSFEQRGPQLSIAVGPHELRTLRLRPEG